MYTKLRQIVSILVAFQGSLLLMGAYYSHNYFRRHSCLINSTGYYTDLAFYLVSFAVFVLASAGLVTRRKNRRDAKIYILLVCASLGLVALSVKLLVYSQGC